MQTAFPSRSVRWVVLLALAVLLALFTLRLRSPSPAASIPVPHQDPVTLVPPVPASRLPQPVGAEPAAAAEYEAERLLSEAIGHAWVVCPPLRGERVSGWRTNLPYRYDASGLAFSTTDAAGTFYVRRSLEDPTVVSILRWSVAPDGRTSCEQTDADLVDTVLRVVDGAGEPVEGVSVYSTITMARGAKTDADGRVSFAVAAGHEAEMALTWKVDEGGGRSRLETLPSVRVRAGEVREVTVTAADARPYDEGLASGLADMLAEAEEQVAAIDRLLAAPDVPEAHRALWTERRTQWETFLMVRAKDLLPDGTLVPRPPRTLGGEAEAYREAREQLESERGAD